MNLPTLILIGLLATAQSLSAEALDRFRTDNEICTLGMSALAELTKIDIHTNSLSRRSIGNCTAKLVSVTLGNPRVTFLVKRMEWNRQGLTPLIEGLLPEQLRLEFHNVRVTSAPKDDPAWSYLARSGIGGRKFNANLALTFNPETGQLDLNGATIDFNNGNRVTLTANLRGVNPTLPNSLGLSVLAIVAENVSFVIQSGAGRENPAIGMGMAMLKHEISPEGMEHFKGRAIKYIDENLHDRLPESSTGALKRLIADMPHPKGDIILQLKSGGGFALMGLFLMRKGADPAQVLGGLGASFNYGPGIAGLAR